jgi:hypothetical protein
MACQTPPTISENLKQNSAPCGGGRRHHEDVLFLILLAGAANAQTYGYPSQFRPYQPVPNMVPNNPGLRPLPIIPPLGASNCHQVMVCDQFNRCSWQNVCR